ncbi:MAG: hypothetical protein K9L28_08265 [Synergistales bacterium]|nr:hypothetical protein [Synergistales bacterium]
MKAACCLVLCGLLAGAVPAGAAIPDDPYSSDHLLVADTDFMFFVLHEAEIRASYCAPDDTCRNLNKHWEETLPYDHPKSYNFDAAWGTLSPDRRPMVGLGDVAASDGHLHFLLFSLTSGNSGLSLEHDYDAGFPITPFGAYPQDNAVDVVAEDWTGDGTTDYACAFLGDQDGGLGYSILVANGDPETTNSTVTKATGSWEDDQAGYSIQASAADIDGDGRKELFVLAKEGPDGDDGRGTYRLRAFAVDSDDLSLQPLENGTYDLADYTGGYDTCAIGAGDAYGEGSVQLFAAYTAEGGRDVRLGLVSADIGDGGLQWEVLFDEKICETHVQAVGESKPARLPLYVSDLNADGRDECCLLSSVAETSDPTYKHAELHVAGVTEDGTSLEELASTVVHGFVGAEKYMDVGAGVFGAWRPGQERAKRRQVAVYGNRDTGEGGGITLFEPTLDDNGAITGLTMLGDDLWTGTLGKLLPGDFAGNTLQLGPPTKITVENNITPLVVMQEPPKHLDYIRCFSGDQPCICNASRSTFYYTEFSDKQTSDKIVKTKQKTSTGYGRSISSKQEASLNLEVVEISSNAEESLSKSWEHRSSHYDERYAETETSISAKTTKGDMVSYRCQDTDIWRYPIIGETGVDGRAYYQVVVPHPVETNIVAGHDLAWFQPPHISGNILTYPWTREMLPFNTASADRIGGGTNYELGNSVTWDISWSRSVTEGESTESSVKNESEESISVAMGGEVAYLSGNAEVTATFTHDHCSDSSTSNTNSITKTSGFTVELPTFPGSDSFAYQVTPLVYSTDVGNFAVTYLADLRTGNYDWWVARYGHAPNPALGLPHQWRLEKSSNETEEDWWVWRGYNQIQGMFFYDSRGRKTGHVLQGGDEALASPVTLRCRIYNLAVQNDAHHVRLTGLPVRFAYSSDKVPGVARPIGSDTVDIAPWGSEEQRNWSWAEVSWDLTGLPEGRYHVLVTADPSDDITEIANHDNGDRYSDNQGWFEVYVTDGSGNPGGSRSALYELDGELDVSPDQVAEGEAVTVEAEIHNPTAESATNVFVAFYDGSPGDRGGIVAHRYIPGIGPGETRTEEVRYFPERSGTHVVTMIIDDSPHEHAEVAESFSVGTSSEGGCSVGATGPFSSLLLLAFFALVIGVKRR